MPVKQAGKKALRQTKKRTVKNIAVKKAYEDALKAVKKAFASGGKDIQEKLRLAQKLLDKAAQKGLLKKNSAARKLSRLAKKVHGIAEKK